MYKPKLKNIALVILGGIALMLILSPLVGYRFDTVRSGSMAPEMNVGDLAITAPTNPENIMVNDVIAVSYTHLTLPTNREV